MTKILIYLSCFNQMHPWWMTWRTICWENVMSTAPAATPPRLSITAEDRRSTAGRLCVGYFGAHLFGQHLKDILRAIFVVIFWGYLRGLFLGYQWGHFRGPISGAISEGHSISISVFLVLMLYLSHIGIWGPVFRAIDMGHYEEPFFSHFLGHLSGAILGAPEFENLFFFVTIVFLSPYFICTLH